MLFSPYYCDVCICYIICLNLFSKQKKPNKTQKKKTPKKIKKNKKKKNRKKTQKRRVTTKIKLINGNFLFNQAGSCVMLWVQR